MNDNRGELFAEDLERLSDGIGDRLCMACAREFGSVNLDFDKVGMSSYRVFWVSANT